MQKQWILITEKHKNNNKKTDVTIKEIQRPHSVPSVREWNPGIYIHNKIWQTYGSCVSEAKAPDLVCSGANTSNTLCWPLIGPRIWEKGLRTDRVLVNLALLDVISSKILISWHALHFQKQQFNWIIAVLFSKLQLDYEKEALMKHKWHKTVSLRFSLWHLEGS